MGRRAMIWIETAERLIGFIFCLLLSSATRFAVFSIFKNQFQLILKPHLEFMRLSFTPFDDLNFLFENRINSICSEQQTNKQTKK